MNLEAKQKIVVLGATGSIGDSTLDVIARNSEKFDVIAVSAHTNYKKLAKICEKFQPKYAVLTDESAYKKFDSKVPVELHLGYESLNSICKLPEVDMVVAGIVGSAGMSSVLTSVKAGKTLLLANKEALVVAGELVMNEAKKNNSKIIPLDSEHNAIYQCLPDEYTTGERPIDIDKIILTASGGPFWELPTQDFSSITPQQACNHPNWNMGRKISVDSATLMNKGLEIIEAHWLFNLSNEKIDVHIHPQSIIHSMVCYIDGSVIAQLGEPDMRVPIAYGLGLESRIISGANMLNLLEKNRLDFVEPNVKKFPCLKLARESIDFGGTAMAVLNYSNEEAVESFLSGKIKFIDIPRINQEVLESIQIQNVESVSHLLSLEREVRSIAREKVSQLC